MLLTLAGTPRGTCLPQVAAQRKLPDLGGATLGRHDLLRRQGMTREGGWFQTVTDARVTADRAPALAAVLARRGVDEVLGWRY